MPSGTPHHHHTLLGWFGWVPHPHPQPFWLPLVYTHLTPHTPHTHGDVTVPVPAFPPPDIVGCVSHYHPPTRLPCTPFALLLPPALRTHPHHHPTLYHHHTAFTAPFTPTHTHAARTAPTVQLPVCGDFTTLVGWFVSFTWWLGLVGSPHTPHTPIVFVGLLVPHSVCLFGGWFYFPHPPHPTHPGPFSPTPTPFVGWFRFVALLLIGSSWL